MSVKEKTNLTWLEILKATQKDLMWGQKPFDQEPSHHLLRLQGLHQPSTTPNPQAKRETQRIFFLY